MKRWQNDEKMIHNLIWTIRIAVHIRTTLHVTLQPPWLDVGYSEWTFDNVLQMCIISYHFNSMTVRVEQAPLERCSPSLVLQQKLVNDVLINYFHYCRTSCLPVISKELFYHQIYSPFCDTYLQAISTIP